MTPLNKIRLVLVLACGNESSVSNGHGDPFRVIVINLNEKKYS